MYSIAAEVRKQTLIISIDGRIDSSSAFNVGNDIEKIRCDTPYEELVLDFDRLEFISSAGLRLILKLKKEEKSFRLINVNADVYDILDMTGFCEIVDVERAFRKISVDGCEIIGEGAKGIVYRYNDDNIVKVYKKDDCLPVIRHERELARKAFILGVPTAISYDVVKVGDRYGSVFELLDAKSLSEQILDDPEGFDRYVEMFADLLKQIHSTYVNPDELVDAKEKVYLWLEQCSPYFDDEKNARIRAMVDAVPNTGNMLHGDFHTNNIMMQNGEAILIDMDSLSRGHPIFELANIYLSFVGFGETNPAAVEAFLGLPYATAVEIWNKFLPLYLGGYDRVREVEDKVILLSFCRHLRHTARRGVNTEKDKATVEYCVKKIEKYLDLVDSLAF